MAPAALDDCISEESDYYGDEQIADNLEAQESDFDVSTFWSYHSRLPAVLARAHDTLAVKSSRPLKNIYEGEPHHARQLAETPADFVRRLPPSTTPKGGEDGWLWIANPHDPHSVLAADHRGLTQEGEAILERYTKLKEDVERKMKGKAADAIARRLRPAQDQLAKDLRNVAAKHNVVTGKWMLFAKADDLDNTWATVCQGVAEGTLGIAAKVATLGAARDEGVRLICVCTKDFSDEADVLRVLHGIADLGLLDDQKSIWYKTDAYSHLGIEGKNEYGLKNSLYSSRDLLSTR